MYRDINLAFVDFISRFWSVPYGSVVKTLDEVPAGVITEKFVHKAELGRSYCVRTNDGIVSYVHVGCAGTIINVLGGGWYQIPRAAWLREQEALEYLHELWLEAQQDF